MADTEKVIRWLRNCDGHTIFTGHGCEKCPYFEDGNISGEECVERLHLDALELLKKQEPKPVKRIDDSEVGICSGLCPKCQKRIYYNILYPADFCKYCGQAVKWDE